MSQKMVGPLYSVSLDRGDMTSLPQVVLDTVERITRAVLGMMRAEGNFHVRCNGKVRGSSDWRGKYRVGIFFRALHQIEIRYQHESKDACYEYRITIPHSYDIEDFFNRFVREARKLTEVIIGTNSGVMRGVESQGARPVTTTPPQSDQKTPASGASTQTPVGPVQKRKPVMGFSLKDMETVEVFMSLLSERADVTGVLTRAQFDAVVSEFVGGQPSGLVLGQKLRRLKALQLIADTPRGELIILNLDEYRKPKPEQVGLAENNSGAQVITDTLHDDLVSATARATDQLTADLARRWEDAKALEQQYGSALAKITSEIARLESEKDRIAGLLKTLSGILVPGGLPELAARRLGKIQ